MDTTQAANLQTAALAEYALKATLGSNHPDLMRVAQELGEEIDLQNAQAIDTRFMQKIQRDGCLPTYGTYEACYCEALQAGEIQLPLAAMSVNFQTAEEVQAADREQRRSLGSRNIADQLLTGEGSYRWNVAHREDSGDTEALAAMRKQMGGR
jgi:hypothetical protein